MIVGTPGCNHRGDDGPSVANLSLRVLDRINLLLGPRSAVHCRIQRVSPTNPTRYKRKMGSGADPPETFVDSPALSSYFRWDLLPREFFVEQFRYSCPVPGPMSRHQSHQCCVLFSRPHFSTPLPLSPRLCEHLQPYLASAAGMCTYAL